MLNFIEMENFEERQIPPWWDNFISMGIVIWQMIISIYNIPENYANERLNLNNQDGNETCWEIFNNSKGKKFKEMPLIIQINYIIMTIRFIYTLIIIHYSLWLSLNYDNSWNDYTIYVNTICINKLLSKSILHGLFIGSTNLKGPFDSVMMIILILHGAFSLPALITHGFPGFIIYGWWAILWGICIFLVIQVVSILTNRGLLVDVWKKEREKVVVQNIILLEYIAMDYLSVLIIPCYDGDGYMTGFSRSFDSNALNYLHDQLEGAISKLISIIG